VSSLAIAQALQAAMESGDALGTWAEDAAGQATPRVIVGYRKPNAAKDYPFVSLVPARDATDLLSGITERATLAVVCGAHDPDTVADGSRGYALVSGLWGAVVSALAAPVVVDSLSWAAQTAELVDVELSHPMYITEHSVELRLCGSSPMPDPPPEETPP
jgi:hypothetical protein